MRPSTAPALQPSRGLQGSLGGGGAGPRAGLDPFTTPSKAQQALASSRGQHAAQPGGQQHQQQHDPLQHQQPSAMKAFVHSMISTQPQQVGGAVGRGCIGGAAQVPVVVAPAPPGLAVHATNPEACAPHMRARAGACGGHARVGSAGHRGQHGSKGQEGGPEGCCSRRQARGQGRQGGKREGARAAGLRDAAGARAVCRLVADATTRAAPQPACAPCSPGPPAWPRRRPCGGPWAGRCPTPRTTTAPRTARQTSRASCRRGNGAGGARRRSSSSPRGHAASTQQEGADGARRMS